MSTKMTEEQAKMTEEQAEHAKRLMDQLNALLLSNALSQEEYDILAQALERVAKRRHRVPKPKRETEDLVLWATNHAPFYQTHLKLAREKAPHASWVRHVTGTVIPGYRRDLWRDLHEPHPVMSAYETFGVAIKLMEYYAEHIAEEG